LCQIAARIGTAGEKIKGDLLNPLAICERPKLTESPVSTKVVAPSDE
jgi:hypothetical protein